MPAAAAILLIELSDWRNLEERTPAETKVARPVDHEREMHVYREETNFFNIINSKKAYYNIEAS